MSLLHNNAMASISKLKVEAKARGIHVEQTDEQLMAQSCKFYLASLKLMEDNAEPTPVTDDVMISGSKGFISTTMKQGTTTLVWRIDSVHPEQNLWSEFEFNGPARGINQIECSILSHLPDKFGDVPQNGENTFISPTECLLQASSASLGGEYVTVASCQHTANDQNRIIIKGFRTSKAKKWRVVLRASHISAETGGHLPIFCGIEMNMMEASLSYDSLQLLHVLHNARESFEVLKQIEQQRNSDEERHDFAISDVSKHLRELESDSSRIETAYITSTLSLHHASRLNVTKAVRHREQLEEELKKYTKSGGCWDYWCDEWFHDVLAAVVRFGSSREQVELCSRIHETLHRLLHGAFDQKENRQKSFPDFADLNGLHQGLMIRFREFRSKIGIGSVAKLLKKFEQFPSSPDISDIEMSASCKRCKHDWKWKGPMCRHCQLSVSLQELVPDRLLVAVLEDIYSWMRGARLSGALQSTLFDLQAGKRAELFFKAHDSTKKERSAAERAWRVHLTLLNELDELNICKRSMRLYDGEDLTMLTDAELNGVILPTDLQTSFYEHEAKHAMALGNLGRQQSTLRYLRHQKSQRYSEENANSTPNSPTERESCSVCLSPFAEGNQAVLSCGHSFCYSPCLNRIMTTQPGGSRNVISCPLRCVQKTKREDIMICKADDGSELTDRSVKGSWGTKVTRLISDVKGVSSLGQKSVVFSMWEDMLDIVEEALRVNDISYVRAASLRKMAESTQAFRSSECSVLLLNVKNGAEGLTLVEATHVFMIEPLLNNALDFQAINRVHRIGQTSKTYVHRYLVQGTIEMKIDKLRADRGNAEVEASLEDSLSNAKHSAFKIGGIDGGFNEIKDLLEILDDKS